MEGSRWKEKFPTVFTEKVGKMKSEQIRLHIDESVQPVKGKLRPVPFHLREKVEKEILRMLEEDLIEPVDGPTPWVSPIVIVPKSNDKIRICTNAAIKQLNVNDMQHLRSMI